MVDDAFDLAAVHAEVAGYPTLAAAVVVATLVVTTWLLAIASSAKSGTDLANARLDAVRTGLAVP